MTEPHLIFLVHGRCVCGWECACPEGSTWPACPVCGESVMPPRPKPSARTERGRENGRLGYVLLPEQEALRLARPEGYEYKAPVMAP